MIRRIAISLLLALPAVVVSTSAFAQYQMQHEGDPHAPGHVGEGDVAPTEPEHHATSLGEVLRPTNFEFWGAVVNFAAVLFLLTWLGKRPITNYLRQRRLAVEEGLLEAQRLKAEAQAKFDEYSSRLAKLDEELASIRADMVKAGEAERDRIVAEAEAKAARMRRDTEFLIEQELKQLREDVTREAVETAIATAEQVLRGAASASDQQRLAEQYLATLKKVGSGQAKPSPVIDHRPLPTEEHA